MRGKVLSLVVVLLAGLTQPWLAEARPVAQAATMGVQQQLNDGAIKETIIAQGKFGTVDFYLTESGDLHLGAGTLPEYATNPDDQGRGQLLAAVTRAYFQRPNVNLNNLLTVAKLIQQVIFDGPVRAAKDSTMMFARLTAVATYVNLAQLDTSQTENMSLMFSQNSRVTALDVSHFDTSRATRMQAMFSSCFQLAVLDVSRFKTDRVKNVDSMLASTSALTTIDFASGTFAATTDASQVFYRSGVQRLNLPLMAAPGNSAAMLYETRELSHLTLGPHAQQNKRYGLANAPKNAQYTGNWQIVGAGTPENPLGEKFTAGSQVGQRDPNLVLTTPDTYVWEPVERVLPPSPPPVTPPPVATAQPVIVSYLDDQGHRLAVDRQLTGALGTTYQATPQKFDGYRLARTSGAVVGVFTTVAQHVTFHYALEVETGGDGAGIAPVSAVVYATKKVGLYRHPTFSSSARRYWYPKQKRPNRPMFVVTGYATSKNGHLRYRVRDVNHRSKTAGKTGYLTANVAYVRSVYYAKRQSKINVINPKGVNGYRHAALKGKQRHYRRGQTLRVRKIVTYRKTTRFVLTNGQYVTANKKLVLAQ